MSLGEFRACMDGYRKANSPGEKLPPPTPDEFADMLANYHAMTKH